MKYRVKCPPVTVSLDVGRQRTPVESVSCGWKGVFDKWAAGLGHRLGDNLLGGKLGLSGRGRVILASR